MPELPEVETTRRGIEPLLLGALVEEIVVREPRLRWPVPDTLRQMTGQRIERVDRRGKYLLIGTAAGTLLIHLGMSGSLRFVSADQAPGKHDHVDLKVRDAHGMERLLRYHDPRRFGSWLWTCEPLEQHPLLASLGPEPLGNAFNGDYLFRASRKRRVPIKSLIMNSHVVVGVGNIYASEALFLAGVRPERPAAKLTRREAEALADAIRQILQRAIESGGTTLRDFVNGHGQPGYFAQSLNVYGREGEPCRHCGAPVVRQSIGQRSSFYCKKCQK